MALYYASPVGRNESRLRSGDASYATSRTGGTITGPTTTSGAVGQQLTGFYCYNTWMEYNVHNIPAGSTITAISYTVSHTNDTANTDFNVEVYENDYGAAVDTGDWPDPDALGDRLAYISTVGIGTGVKSYTEEAAFVTAAQAALDENRPLKLLICSSRWRIGNQPSGNEYVIIDGDSGGYMGITYTPPTADETDIIGQTDDNDARLRSSNATYSTARSGGTITLTTGDDGVIGQQTGYNIYQTFAEIDISGIPAEAIITELSIRIYYSNKTIVSDDFFVTLAKYDWGAAVDITDFRSGTQLLAFKDDDQRIGIDYTSGITAGAWGALSVQTSFCDGIPLLQAAVDAEDTTFKYIMYSQRNADGDVPTNNEYVRPEGSTPGTNYGAEWTISYTLPGEEGTMNTMVMGAAF